MTPQHDTSLCFRRLGPRDRGEAVAIAGEAFAGNRFYEESLGFDARAFAAYWDAFLQLALRDPSARVLGVDVDGRLGAVLAIAYQGFPGPWRGLCFILSLLRRIGLRRTLTYLRFVADYERAMHQPETDASREARGLWLMARSRANHPRIGSALARFVVAYVSAEGRDLCTGFVDAGNVPLLAFYRRIGFRIGPFFPFHGRWAVRVERDGRRGTCAP
jgi:ribosomal protein S18 acetylase RimI-like enzyme